MHEVTFETKCWERDWEFLLLGGRLLRMIDACRYRFARKVLYINNVKNRGRVEAAARNLVGAGTISEYVFVQDHAKETLDCFGIVPASFEGGYWYSIQELVGIHRCTAGYLLHFSGDSIMCNAQEWIDSAIERMEKDRTILVANPNWDRTEKQVMHEMVSDEGGFFRSQGFSDQCYLIDPTRLNQPIYNESHPDTAVYPAYGGELFEKRINAYMRNHGCYRITSKKAQYRHRNFPHDPLRKWILLRLGMNLKK